MDSCLASTKAINITFFNSVDTAIRSTVVVSVCYVCPRLIIFIVVGWAVTVLTPLVVNSLEHRGLFRRYPWSNAPLQVLLCGVFLTFATPLACALFSQRVCIGVSRLEDDIQVGIPTENVILCTHNYPAPIQIAALDT